MTRTYLGKAVKLRAGFFTNKLVKWLRSPRTAALILAMAGTGMAAVRVWYQGRPFPTWPWLRVLAWLLFFALLASLLACTFSLLPKWIRGVAVRPQGFSPARLKPGLVALFHLGLAAGMVLFAVAPFFAWEANILLREGSRLAQGKPGLRVVQQGRWARVDLGEVSLTVEAVDLDHRVPGYKEGVASYLTVVDGRGFRREMLTRRGPLKVGEVLVYQRKEAGVSVVLLTQGGNETVVNFIDFGLEEIQKALPQSGKIEGLGKVTAKLKPLANNGAVAPRNAYGLELEWKGGKVFLRAGESFITPEGVTLRLDNVVYWTGLTLKRDPVYPWLAGVLGLTAAVFVATRFM